MRAAFTEIPPVSDSGMRSVRRTLADTFPVALTDSTGPMRPIIPTDSSGRDASSPNRVWPGVTVSRLVPSRSSWARRSARLEAEIPSTDTMAAIPRAIPSPDSPVRSRRVRRPTLPTRNTSAGAIRAGTSGAGASGGAEARVAVTPAPPAGPGRRGSPPSGAGPRPAPGRG